MYGGEIWTIGIVAADMNADVTAYPLENISFTTNPKNKGNPMSVPLLYLLFVVLPSFSCFLSTICVFGILSVIIFGLCWAFNLPPDGASDEARGAAFLKNLRLSVVVVVVAGFLCCFLPDEKAVYTIAGAYAVTNDEELAKLPNNVIRAANDYLEKLNDVNKHK